MHLRLQQPEGAPHHPRVVPHEDPVEGPDQRPQPGITRKAPIKLEPATGAVRLDGKIADAVEVAADSDSHKAMGHNINDTGHEGEGVRQEPLRLQAQRHADPVRPTAVDEIEDGWTPLVQMLGVEHDGRQLLRASIQPRTRCDFEVVAAFMSCDGPS